MYIEMNPTGLTLTDLICVAHRKRNEDTGFPYAVQSCRCSNCRYVGEGKCSLKECCCMAERVRAHTCIFSEILNTCFANVKDNVFHYRNGNTRKGYWAIAGSGILHHTITNERLARRGYYDISEAYKSVHSI